MRYACAPNCEIFFSVNNFLYTFNRNTVYTENKISVKLTKKRPPAELPFYVIIFSHKSFRNVA